MTLSQEPLHRSWNGSCSTAIHTIAAAVSSSPNVHDAVASPAFTADRSMSPKPFVPCEAKAQHRVAVPVRLPVSILPSCESVD